MAIEDNNSNEEAHEPNNVINATAIEIQESPRVSIIARSSPLIEVIAPATLAEGYSFSVQLGQESRVFNVIVPEGGVEIGQRFLIPWPDHLDFSPVRSDLHHGRWKDGLCSCFNHGCCHAMLCNAICFPFVAISQVMTRLNLSLLGNTSSSNKTFLTAIFVTFLIFIVNIIDISTNPDPSYISLAAFLFYLFILLYTTTITRYYIRNKYNIPTYKCCGCSGECEDVCCAFFCNCCVITQMARHTADYDTYNGYCCTKTGLPDSVDFDGDVLEPLL